jgi:hypothetical protein
MKNELGLIDKIIIIDEMLQKMGYNTDKMKVNEVLDIKNVVEKIINKVQLPVKE